MIEIPLKPKKWPKYPQNLKITKIPSKPKKWPKHSWNLINDQNTPETNYYQNIPKCKRWQEYLQNLKNDQNTLET